MSRISPILSSLVFILLLVTPFARGAGAAKADLKAVGGPVGPPRQRRPAVAGRGGAQAPPGGQIAEAEFVPGEVLVKFKDRAKAVDLARSRKTKGDVLAPANDHALASLFERRSVTEARQPFARARSESLRRVVKLTSHGLKGDPRGTRELVEELRQNPAVEYAEPNYILRAQWTPNDTYFASVGAWGQSFRDLWGLEKINAENAWGLTRGAGVVVAIIDSGVDYGHEDIAPNVWQNAGELGTDGQGRDRRSNGVDDDGNGYVDDWRGWNFVTGVSSPDNDPMDDHGHGTHVAGTVAAVGNNGLGIVGVAPESRVMALKGLDAAGGGTTEDLSEAIVYAAENGAKVINASWGGYQSAPARTMTDAVVYAQQKDVVFVAAAGNDAIDVGTNYNGVAPANIRGVVTVSASDHDDAIASFSNFGPKIDLSAPGGGGADPGGTAANPGRSILSLASSKGGDQMNGGGALVVGANYVRQAGTSMAAPHVAGVAALVRSLHPEFSAEQVRQALRLGADDAGAAGYDEKFGYGRLNAAGALGVTLPVAVQLTAPAETLTGVGQADVRGTVNGAGLAEWHLEYRAADAADGWTLIRSSSNAVNNATLAAWDISGLADGGFELRLTATNTAGQTFEDKLPVRVDNVYVKDPSPEMAMAYLPGAAINVSGTVAPSSLSGYSLLVSKTQGETLPGARVLLAGGGTQAVRDGLLATWDTNGVAPGPYTLTLQATLTNGVQISESVTVIIEPSIHEGTPVKLFPTDTGLAFMNHLVAADVNGDGAQELVIGYGHAVGVYDHAGRLLPGWPRTIDPDGVGVDIQQTPAVGDLDGDGRPEIAAAGGNYIFIWHADGTPMPGWPLPLGWIASTQLSIADVDGDGANELVTANGTLYVIDTEGSALPGWSLFPANERRDFTDFVVCDLDGDGHKEIVTRGDGDGVATDVYVFGSRGELKPGWPRRIEGALPSFMAYPAAGDLDGDGDLEIVVPATGGKVYALQHDGTDVPGWPQQTKGETVNSPAVGDMDGDGRAEVVAGVNTLWENQLDVDYLYAWRGDGTPIPGWPVKETGSLDWRFYGFGAPVLADVDGDGAVDVVASGDLTFLRESLYAYKRDGSRVAGFPKHTAYGGPWATNAPAVADLDNDGLLELTWVDNGNILYVWDLPAPRTAKAPWPMFRHDAALTGASPGAPQPAPVVTTHPSDQTVAEGAPVTFTVAASGRGPLSYQWQRNGADIPGSTSTSYTLASASAADSGAEFGVVVSSPFGRAGSRRAVLTVTPHQKFKTTVATIPAGLLVTLDGVTQATPASAEGAAGTPHALGVVTPQTVGGVTYDFDSWSDGGAASHDITTPAADTTYTATFRARSSLQLSAATYSAAEGVGSIGITVTRAGGSSGMVSVSYATADGTAAAGADYAAASGTITFADGETAAKTINVPVTNDALDEDDELLGLTLSAPTGGATLGSPSSAVLTIADDDPTPSLSVGDVSVSEGDGGAVSATFNVTLSSPSGRAVTVSYATADGTATAGADYAAASGVLTFAPGQMSKTVGLNVTGDTLFEPDESFFVNLTSPANATVGDGQGQGWIRNDDRPPTYAVRGQVTNSADGRPMAGVTVTLSGAHSASTTTDDSGGYSFASLPAGGSYTVTAARANYAFAPASRTFNDLDGDRAADFAATRNRHTIRGRVSGHDGSPLAGLTVTLGGAQSDSTTTDTSGSYSFAELPAGFDYTVGVGGTDYYSFSGRGISGLSADTSVDFTGTLRRYSLGGRVTDAAGVGLGGVTVSLGGSATGEAQTDGQGRYTFPALGAGGTYTVSFSKPFYGFAPARASFADLKADQAFDSAGAPLTFKLRGYVTSGGGGLAGVLVKLGGSATATTATDEDGGYAFEVPAGGSYTLTASMQGYAFAPTLHTFSALGGEQTGDFTGTAQPSATPTPTPTPVPSPTPTPLRIEDSGDFVTQHYRDFLNREPDAEGLRFWAGDIEQCGSDLQCREVHRINVSAAFFLSIEFQETGYLVERVYKAAYGDATSPNVAGTVPVIRRQEFLPDAQRISQGVRVGFGDWQQQLEANKNAYALEFVRRERFQGAYPLTLSPAEFVDRLNERAGGPLSRVERDQLVGELAADDTESGRAGVLRRVAEDEDLRRAELNRAFVLMQFYGYLRRDPDAAPDADFRGWKFWLDKLNQFGGNYVQAEMVKAFTSSDEYRMRFGQ